MLSIAFALVMCEMLLGRRLFRRFALAMVLAVTLLLGFTCMSVCGQEGDCLISQSTPGTAAEVNEFSLNDRVYVRGTGLYPGLTYRIYVVYDTGWIPGTVIPASVPGTLVVDVTGATDGTFIEGTVLVWEGALGGEYDIIADCTTPGFGNPGSYDVWDHLDDGETGASFTCGFFVIPEVPLGSVTATTLCFAAMVALAIRKRS